MSDFASGGRVALAARFENLIRSLNYFPHDARIRVRIGDAANINEIAAPSRAKRTLKTDLHITLQPDWEEAVFDKNMAVIEVEGMRWFCLSAQEVTPPEGCDGAWWVRCTLWPTMTLSGYTVAFGGRLWPIRDTPNGSFLCACLEVEHKLMSRDTDELPF